MKFIGNTGHYLYNLPNQNYGGILGYDPNTKQVSYRTNSQLVTDLGLSIVYNKEDSHVTSARDMNGVLITTSLDYSQFQGDAWILEIKGNTYGGGLPLFCMVQGYVWNDTMVNTTGFSTVDYFNNILVTNLNGKICFWFPKFFYWQGFSVKMTMVTTAGRTNNNYVTSITEQSSDPGGTKRVNIPITTLATSTNGWTGLPDNTNWVGHGAITQRKVIGEIAWKNYGNNHTIFDASSGFAPDGTQISRTDPQNPWSSQYPTWMGWNGFQTYGVRVDSARRADELGNYGAQNYVTVFSQQEIYGLKLFNKPARNTGTGWGNNSTLADYTMGIFTDSGPDVNNNKTASLGFYSNSGVQAGIYVRSNDGDGTSMAFATANSFGLGPQIAMTINNVGTVDFPRAWPTVAGKNIFHGGNTIDYDHGVADIISVGDPSWAQRKVLSTHWDGTYGDHVILRPPGNANNTSTFKLSQNGNGYIGDKRVLTDADFNSTNYVQSWEGATALGFSNGNPNNNPYIYSNIDGSYRFLATIAFVSANYLPLSGGTLTGGGRIDTQANIVVQQNPNGGNATGMFWDKMDDSARMSGIGTLTNSGDLTHMFMGWGPSPWDSSTAFVVSPSRLAWQDKKVWTEFDFTVTNVNNWNFAFNKMLTDYTKETNQNGDRHKFFMYDGNILIKDTYGLGVVDTRNIGNGLGNTDGSSAYIPNTKTIPALNHKLLPLFHTFYKYGGTWATSLISKGWNDAYRAWRIIGPADSEDIERDFYLSQSRATDGVWMTDRLIWTDKHFTQAQVDHWNSLTVGIMLNADFTIPNGSGNHVAITDDYFGSESGLFDMSQDQAIAVKWGATHYLYGGSPGGWNGLVYNLTNGNYSLYRDSNNNGDRLQINGDISVDQQDLGGGAAQLIMNPHHTFDSDLSQSRYAHIYLVTRSNVRLPDIPIYGQRFEIYNYADFDIEIMHNNVGTLFILPGQCRTIGIATEKGYRFDRDPVVTRRYDVL